MSLPRRHALTIYFAANLALTFALALPAAGMLKHILPVQDSLADGFQLWLGLTGLCWLITLPVIPIARRRLEQRAAVNSPGETEKVTEYLENMG